MDASDLDESFKTSASCTPRNLTAPNNKFAFLVHSADTLPLNLPPNVDDKILARQRRRRTSPEDQSVLEAEFLRNPRPDKACRRAIVDRVALGEKEVQIWFQNRRQTNRRRSRPLSREDQTPDAQGTQQPAQSKHEGEVHNELGMYSQTASASRIGDPKPDSGRLDSGLQSAVQECFPAVKSVLRDVDYNRQSSQGSNGTGLAPTTLAASMSHEETVDKNAAENSRGEKPFRPLKRSHSGVRLSMTSTGGAKLMREDESSPSPPKHEKLKPLPLRIGDVRRRLSVPASADELHIGVAEVVNYRRRMPSGHSRNSLAWEFWCDGEARGELAKKADLEQKGSAANAISLMRSKGRNPLSIIAGRTDLREPEPSKRARIHQNARTRPTFVRVRSSVGRLQSCGKPELGPFEDSSSQPNSPAVICSNVHPSHGDSDKENEDPNCNSKTTSTRRIDPTRAAIHGRKPMLRESLTDPGAAALSSRERRLKPRYGTASTLKISDENNSIRPEEDQELKCFMEGANANKARSLDPGEEDLDCVQGLLSLSQGNWK